MKSKIKLVSISIVAFQVGITFKAHAEISAIDIMKKNFVVSKVKDSGSESIMKLVDANGKERIREMATKTRLVDGTTDTMRLVTFSSPADVKGTKTLIIEKSDGDDGIWVYLPSLKKVRRLVASNKKDSFAGSDFSYGDMVGFKVDEWNHKLIKEDACGKQKCFIIESSPKKPDESEATGYSKFIGWYDKNNMYRTKAEVYDLQGKLLKVITADKVTQVDKANNKWFAYLLEAKNIQTGRKTIFEIKNYKANIGVSANLFKAGNLEK